MDAEKKGDGYKMEFEEKIAALFRPFRQEGNYFRIYGTNV